MDAESESNTTLGEDQSEWPEVAVILLNWNSYEDTASCLDSLANVEYPNYQVVVVDNGSTDESLDKIQAEYNWCKYIINEENLGFTTGNNIGMEYAFENGADYSLILNNDTIVTREFLTPLVKRAEQDEKIGLVGGIIRYWEDRDQIWFAGGRFNTFLETERIWEGKSISEVNLDNLPETDWISGCMMLIPKEIYYEIGGFREEFFIWAEEWDYSLRVTEAGYKLDIVRDSVIYHKVGEALGVMSPLSYYYGTRNNLALKQLYLPSAQAYLYYTWFLLTRVARFSQFIFDGRVDLVRAGISAILDFFRSDLGKWKKQENYE